MNLRNRILGEGWYPDNKKEVLSIFSDWAKDYKDIKADSGACVVPHAGWYYSGKLAFAGISSLEKDADLIVVCGGHLGESSAVMAALEDGFETPLGTIKNNTAFLKDLESEICIENDVFQDNTVEIQLPIVHHFFPSAKILYLRAPMNQYAGQLGEVICDLSEKKGIKTAFIASTDLTHYGPNYAFTDKGIGEDAVQWVKEVNDKNIINAMLDMNPEKIIDLALRDKSACSAGAAAAACTYSKKRNIRKSRILDYFTSYDIQPSSSFVGYVALSYHN